MRETDPEVFELVARHVERRNDSRWYLIDYIDVLIKVMSERSSGSHGRILNELNTWVRTEQGGPIRGIRLALSLEDQELYRREYVDLASLPDRTAFISDLRNLRSDLVREIEESGDRDDTPRG